MPNGSRATISRRGACIPNRQAEHAVEMVQHVVAPLLVPVDDHFRVGAGLEDVAERLELPAQLLEVVDLAVEHDPHRSLGVSHRLMTARKIDDRQAPEPEPDRSAQHVAVVVRTAMRKAARHSLERLPVHRSAITEVELPADSAHVGLSIRSGLRGSVLVEQERRDCGRSAPGPTDASARCPSPSSVRARGTSRHACAIGSADRRTTTRSVVSRSGKRPASKTPRLTHSA